MHVKLSFIYTIVFLRYFPNAIATRQLCQLTQCHKVALSLIGCSNQPVRHLAQQSLYMCLTHLIVNIPQVKHYASIDNISKYV